MKSLNELIDDVRDCTEAANDYRYGQLIPTRGPSADFRAGHRACFNLLAPALKEALNVMEFACDRDCNEGLVRIRAILESKP